MEMHAPIHRYGCRVRYGDTDAAGVVYYANYLRYFEAARTEFMRDLVCTYKSLEEMGFVLPVVECQARYKAPATYDDLLLVETSLVQVKKASCRFNYRVLREEDGKLLAQGYTVHAVVGDALKLSRFPPQILDRLKKLINPKE